MFNYVTVTLAMFVNFAATKKQADGMGKSEMDGVKIDMQFGCPPLFEFPAGKKSAGDSPFSV
jgi:hypothetical protein